MSWIQNMAAMVALAAGGMYWVVEQGWVPRNLWDWLGHGHPHRLGPVRVLQTKPDTHISLYANAKCILPKNACTERAFTISDKVIMASPATVWDEMGHLSNLSVLVLDGSRSFIGKVDQSTGDELHVTLYLARDETLAHVLRDPTFMIWQRREH